MSTNVGFEEYFHMLCWLQLFVGAIPRSMMPDKRVAEVKAMVGWIKWPQFERNKYLLHTCKTRRV